MIQATFSSIKPWFLGHFGWKWQHPLWNPLSREPLRSRFLYWMNVMSVSKFTSVLTISFLFKGFSWINVYATPTVEWCIHATQPSKNSSRWTGTYGAPSDVWSVGIMSYELFTGNLPFGTGNPAGGNLTVVMTCRDLWDPRLSCIGGGIGGKYPLRKPTDRTCKSMVSQIKCHFLGWDLVSGANCLFLGIVLSWKSSYIITVVGGSVEIRTKQCPTSLLMKK